MSFHVSKVSNYGTSNPIVARLVVQLDEILQWTSLSNEEKDVVRKLYYDLHKLLIASYASYERLIQADEQARATKAAKGDSRIVNVPYIPELDVTVQLMLYNFKNYLRELTAVFNVFFQKKFRNASQFGMYSLTKDGDIVKWAKNKFAHDSRLVGFLEEGQSVATEIVEKRNVVEHPKDKPRGRLIVDNYKIKGPILQPPVWSLSGESPVELLPDLGDLIRWLLEFAEVLLVLCVEETKNHSFVELCSIPESKRDPMCPVRFTSALTEEFQKKHGVGK